MRLALIVKNICLPMDPNFFLSKTVLTHLSGYLTGFRDLYLNVEVFDLQTHHFEFAL